MKRYIVNFAFSLLTFLLFSATAYAQSVKWTQIGQGIGLGIQCGYFWDRDDGVIATGNAQFYYIKSGGIFNNIWRPGQKILNATVNSIRCFDGSTLYATVQIRPYDNDELWQSNDSGVTWNQVPGQSSNGYGTDNGYDVYLNYKTNSIVFMGSTVVRLDSLDIITTYDDGRESTPSSSLDGGQTWRVGPITGPSILNYNYLSGIGACADRTNKLYYATADNGAPGIFRSIDSGRNWTCLLNLPQNLYMMDDIEGIYDKTYIQTSKGIYETTDSGNTWVNIGGPARQISDDARFFVFGCTGQAVIAFSDNGSVWIANGWDAPDPNQIHSTFATTTTECDSATIVINVDPDFEPGRLYIQIKDDSSGSFTLLTPDTIQLTSGLSQIIVQFKGVDLAQHNALLSITPIDDGSCPVTHIISGQARLQPLLAAPTTIVVCTAETTKLFVNNRNCEALHVTSISVNSAIHILAFDSSIISLDSISLFVAPADTDTTQHFPLLLIGNYQPSDSAFDTTFEITVKTNHIRSTLGWPQSSSLEFAEKNTCSPFDTSIVLWNTGCDTIAVDLSQFGTLSPDWTITSPSGLHSLYPGQSDTVSIHFFSPVTGVYDQSLNYLYSYGVSKQDVVGFELSVAVPIAGPNFLMTPTSVNLGDRSFCLADTTIDILFQNLRCDSIIVSNAHLTGGHAFSLFAASDSVLPPGEELDETIAYGPTEHGTSQDTLYMHIASLDGLFSTDTSVPCIVNVTRGPAILTSSDTSIDFGATYTCKERDTIVVLQNTGCDSLCVSSIVTSNPQFVLASGQSTEFCMTAGALDTLHIITQIDTSGGQTQNAGLLQVTSNSDSALAPVSIVRGIEYPSPWSLSISQSDSCYPGESIAYNIFQHGLLSQDATGADLQVTFNDDLLKLESIDGPSVSQTGYYRDALGVAHYLLHIAPGTTDSILATLHFFTYQTRATTTAIIIDSVSINSSNQLPSDCITILSLTSSQFSIRNNCNSPLISEALNSTLLSFTVEPNPAMDIAEIKYSLLQNSPANATVYIEDALGRIVDEKAIVLMPGNRNSLPLDIDGLPSGVYCIRIGQSGESTTARLVKE